MRKKTIVLLMLFLCVCSYLAGLYVSGQNYQRLMIKPYLADLSRNLIFVAILQNEGRAVSDNSINLAYSWYKIAKAQGLESESIATWLKTYDSAYGLPSTIKLDSDIVTADSYIFKGESKARLLDSIEQALDVNNNLSSSKTY